MSIDADALERAITAAESRYQQALAGLKRPDGEPLYSPTEQQERELAARATFHKERTGIGERVDAAISEAQAEIAAVEMADPTKDFTTAELERITLRTAIVAEDLRHQPELVQVGRLRAALASGDRAERSIALRAGRALLAARDAGREPGVTLRNGRPVISEMDYSDLAAAVRALEAGFLDARRRERAEAQIAAAQSVNLRLAESTYLTQAYGPRPTRVTTPAAR